MTLEERMVRLEAAFGAQSDLVRELRDAVTVTAELEAREARIVKEHSLGLLEHNQRLADHNRWLADHEQGMQEHRLAMKELDKRIESLVSGFGEFIRRQQQAGPTGGNQI